MPWDINADLPLPEVPHGEDFGEWRISPSLGGPAGKPYAVLRKDGTVHDWHIHRDDAVFQIRSMLRAKRNAEAAGEKANPADDPEDQPQQSKDNRDLYAMPFTRSTTVMY